MQFSIKPKWQPIGTAPKDRPIWLFCRGIDYDSGKQRGYHRLAYWGRMTDYPDHDEGWLPIGVGGNVSVPDDTSLVQRVSIYEDHGRTRELVSYIGTVITHWADVIEHEIIVVSPDDSYWPLPVQKVVTDMRPQTDLAQGIEQWKPSPVFGDLYEVSDLGRVRSTKGVKSPYKDKDGYPTVNLHRARARKACNVHRLVCRAFHGEPPVSGHEAAHLDGVRSNCRADNLTWAGKIQNHSHRRLHGTHPAGEKHPRAKLRNEDVACIRSERGRTSAGALAERFSVSRRAIYDIWQGLRWKHLESPVADRPCAGILFPPCRYGEPGCAMLSPCEQCEDDRRAG